MCAASRSFPLPLDTRPFQLTSFAIVNRAVATILSCFFFFFCIFSLRINSPKEFTASEYKTLSRHCMSSTMLFSQKPVPVCTAASSAAGWPAPPTCAKAGACCFSDQGTEERGPCCLCFRQKFPGSPLQLAGTAGNWHRSSVLPAPYLLSHLAGSVRHSLKIKTNWKKKFKKANVDVVAGNLRI